MANENAPIAVFNRGIVDERAIARVDVKRVAISAREQTNMIPRELGSMTLRPGLEYISGTYNNNEAKHIRFVRGLSDTAIIEMTSKIMRVRVDEQIITRNSVSSAVANGSFDTDLTSWSDADGAGSVSQWVAGGYLGLTGNKFTSAARRQTVTVSQADLNVPHGVKIVVERGTVNIRIGSTSGGAEYFVIACRPGNHSFLLTPTSDLFLELQTELEYECLVSSIEIESSGDMTLSTPWSENDLENLRWDQSNDVIFISADGLQPRRLERHGTNSWSLVKYETNDGPYRSINVSGTTMTASVLTGDGTLTASNPYFDTDHVGAIFRLSSAGQKTSVSVTAENQFGSSIRVTGVGNTRIFDLDLTGTWTATVTLQRSLDEEGTWTDVTTYTTNQDTTVDDGLDNEIAFYRLGVKTGDFTSGTMVGVLEWQGGSIKGNCRVVGYTSTTVVDIVVLDRMGTTTAALNWEEGIWSEFRGWPQAVHLYEGRLWLAGLSQITGSVSDAFHSFSDQITGDSVAINRGLGSGGATNYVNWMLGLPNRLMIGTATAELSVRPKSPDEIITSATFNAKEASTEGSERIQALRVDVEALFVDQTGFGANKVLFDIQANEYTAQDITALTPNIGDPGFVAMAVQRRPDTRVHFIKADGTAAILLFNPKEDIEVWIEAETGDADGDNGAIEDVFVMPGSEEDVVYYCVKRQINGVDVRYLEKWALESECIGGIYNAQADSFSMFINNPASATVTGLDHLEGETVVCWADSKCLKDANEAIQTFTVSGGSITLTDEGSSYLASQGIVGLAYRGRFKSGILPYAVSNTALGQKQRIANIALILQNTHNRGLKFGRDYDNMDDIPRVIEAAEVDADDIHSSITIPAVNFPGETSAKARLHLEANAPRPATVMAAILGLASYEHSP